MFSTADIRYPFIPTFYIGINVYACVPDRMQDPELRSSERDVPFLVGRTDCMDASVPETITPALLISPAADPSEALPGDLARALSCVNERKQENSALLDSLR